MIGNDYFQGVKNIGPKHAHKFMLKHKSLEKIVQEEKSNFNFSALTPGIISRVRKIFLLPEVVTKYQDIRWNYPNEQKTLFLLCEDHHLNKERVQNNYEKFSNNFEKCRTYFEAQKNNRKTVQNTLDQIVSWCYEKLWHLNLMIQFTQNWEKFYHSQNKEFVTTLGSSGNKLFNTINLFSEYNKNPNLSVIDLGILDKFNIFYNNLSIWWFA